MATPLQSSGHISLSDIRNYIGQSGQISLSGTTGIPYSVNQIFNSQVGSVVPLTNTLSLSNMYSKTFAMYTTFQRTLPRRFMELSHNFSYAWEKLVVDN